MAAIRGQDTKPEILIRKGLHALGFRYRTHAKGLLGKPDLVFTRYKAVVFINGCFWHRHDCHMFKWPLTRPEFWQEKIGRNAENDVRNLEKLSAAGWRIATVWECAVRGRTRIGADASVQLLAEWLRSGDESVTIRGEE